MKALQPWYVSQRISLVYHSAFQSESEIQRSLLDTTRPYGNRIQQYVVLAILADVIPYTKHLRAFRQEFKDAVHVASID
jgi:hypothetical protein